MAFRILLDGAAHEIEILRRRPYLTLRIDGREHVVEDPGGEGDGLHRLTVAGKRLAVARVQAEGGQILRIAGRSHAAALRDEGEAGGAAADLSEIRAPMPGAVVAIDVGHAEAVSLGAPLVTIESMKLQTVLLAPRDGVIEQILVGQGEIFEKDQVLVRLVPLREGTGDA